MVLKKFSESTLQFTITDAIRQSPGLAHWLYKQARDSQHWPSNAELSEAKHSFKNKIIDSRESDILVVFQSPESKLFWLLIEVKINAPFGDWQAEDYAIRCQRVVDPLQLCDSCRTVVIAPQQYLDSHTENVSLFDVSLSLEEIRTAAEDYQDTAAMLLSNHIGKALELFQAGYIPLADLLREGQFDWYCAFLDAYKPHLVPNPSNRSKQARDIFFPVPQQSRGYITHRIFEGEVSVGFMQRGHLLKQAQEYFDQQDLSAVPELRGKSSMYFVQNEIAVPKLVESVGFADQEKKIQCGADAIDLMYKWCLKHERFLRLLVDNSIM